jgi:hypothetical protein
MNKYRPHVFVIPEDDANRQIANGFVLDPNLNERAIQILPPAGGWQNVVDNFRDVHAHELKRYSERRIVLIVDFDRQYEKRFQFMKNEIPNTEIDRVFVLGVLSEPEELKTSAGMSFENIGKELAQDCVGNRHHFWGHDLLQHNELELNRLISSVKSFLFR